MMLDKKDDMTQYHWGMHQRNACHISPAYRKRIHHMLPKKPLYSNINKLMRNTDKFTVNVSREEASSPSHVAC